MLVICNGMIRSGSTLQYNITRRIVEYYNLGEAHGYIFPENYEQITNDLKTWAKDDKIHVVKMHKHHPIINSIDKIKGDIKIIYIYRDIRDVAASAKLKWRTKNNELLLKIESAIEEYYKITSLKDRYLLIQKYEQVKENKIQAIKEITSFLNMKYNLRDISKINEEFSIEKSKEYISDIDFKEKIWFFLLKYTPKKIKKILKIFNLHKLFKIMGFKSYVQHNSSLFHPDHISKYEGRSNYWEKELNDLEINGIINKYKSWLEENNYLK